MDPKIHQEFRLGKWEVHPKLNRLVSKDETHNLEGKIMSVLVALAGTPGEVISKNELLDAVWPNQTVAEGVLTRAIHELRRVLQDDVIPTRLSLAKRRPSSCLEMILTCRWVSLILATRRQSGLVCCCRQEGDVFGGAVV